MSNYLLERRKQKLGIVTVTKEELKKVVAPVKKTKIKPRSKKLTKEMVKYNKEVKIFLAENPVCPVTGGKATQVHHKKGRIGKLLMDKRFWLAVSDEGHRKIELNPEWAKEMGYSISRLKKAA
jgi:hypothetical protein